MMIVATGRARQSLDYAPSLSSSLATSSNTGSSVTDEVIVPSNPTARPMLTTASSSTFTQRSSLDLFKMDFSTLLRSHSTSSNTERGKHPVLLSDQAVVVDGEAEMFHAPAEDREESDRLARKKNKPENKFYRFLTRSRSRSSPRTNASASISEELASAIPESSQNHEHSIHSRDSSWSSARSSKNRPMSSKTATSKPSTILQSRPLSSTTTATNTTITPPTPKASRHMSSSIPKPPEPSPLAPKSPTSARQRLHNIFGRRSSISSSKDASPGQSNTDLENVPPIPTHSANLSAEGHTSNTPRPKRNFDSRPTSPSPFPRYRKSSSEPSASTTTTNSISNPPSSKLESLFKPKFFSGSRRAQSPPPALSLSHSANAISPMPTPSSSNSGSSNANNHVPIVSGPSKHASTSKISRRRASTNESISSISSVQRAAHLHAPQPRPAPVSITADGPLPVPRIIHTPATPLRSGTAPPRLSQTHRNDSLDSGYRFRPLVMDMVDEERDSREVDVKGKGKETKELIRSRTPSKGKESDHSSASGHKSSSANHHHRHHSTRHHIVKPKTSNITNIRSVKHGSFDFERPGWGLGPSTVTRSLSGTSGNSGVTGFNGGRHSNRSGESVESALPSTNERLAKRKKGSDVKTSSKREEFRTQKRNTLVNDDPAPPYSATPASTDASTERGLSSSLGRSAGKRTAIARLIGLGGYTAHGAFSFERPVPSPISPSFSHASQESNAASSRNEEKEREQKRKEREKEKADEKEKARTKNNNRYSEQDTFGVSSFSSASSKPGRKGRSLDLGIGLAWAPTKVREDVLLPGGIFANGRGHGRISDSTGSRNGLRVGRDRAVDEFGVEDRSKVGRDVAEMFKKALDPEGYRAFKKYVHQFDAREITFDGPNGIIARAQRLLDKRSDLGEESKKKLVDRLVKIVLQNA
ncbi:hypothetical protein J3R30DRAFT_2748732 [Lentinula aciculospora]|uniref:Uncharacterized protein n=1 Tax=Lentinula aciculospora TaxID=153920 RepID=A0A9W9ACX7_9AGAR|nr:hypothetical protein J3R30DRAFT_2748732 [Lentinula aciculospora]